MWMVPERDRIVSPHHSSRHGEGVEGVVIHQSVSPTESEAREVRRLRNVTKRTTGNIWSAHDVLLRSGRRVQMVPYDRAAWHTDDETASWFIGNRTVSQPVDRFTIGIELMNVGPLERQPDGTYRNVYKGVHTGAVAFDALGVPYEPFTVAQIAALRALVYELCAAFPTLCDPLRWTGHEDIQPGKVDPGAMFPWADLRGWVLAARDGVCV